MNRPRRRIFRERIPVDARSSFSVTRFKQAHYPFQWHYHPEAELTLITSDGKQVLHLIGDATGRDFDRTSFYACACSGPGAPTGGWPIAFAVVLVIVRRRRGSS